jgi:uncharacterized protein YqhQ
MQTDKEKGACPKVKTKKTSIGGQALIEGIMMRGPKKISMAVRNPDGDMIVETWNADMEEKPQYFRWPFFRGVFGFIDSMKFGYKCLMRSAEIAGLDEDSQSGGKEKKADHTGAQPIKNAGDNPVVNDMPSENMAADIEISSASAAGETAADTETLSNASDKSSGVKASQKKKDNDSFLMNTIMVVASVLGVILAILLFKGLPELLYQLLEKLFPVLDGDGYGYQLIRSLFVGILKILILVGYMALITLMKEIKRTFMYHGAEHKSIMCYEHGLELTVANVRAQRRFHPRCGTSFLILMVIVGIFITMFIPTRLSDNGTLNVVLRTLISIALLPVMMSIGYELIRIAGKHDNWFMRIISAPGLWLQRITTKEPEDGMIECAITALKNVIPGDGSDDWNKK